MTIRPGARLIWLLGVIALWSLLSLVWPATAWLIPPLLLALAVAPVLEYRQLAAALAATSVRRRLTSPVARDKPFAVRLEISIARGGPWTMEIRDELPAEALPALWIERLIVPASGEAAVSRSFRIPIRGRYHFGPIWVRLVGRYGLLEAQKSLGDAEAVEVYPESLRSEAALAKDASDELRLLDKLRQSRQRGVGTEFESLADFRFGDDPRRIDWRASAKYRRPIVRRFQIERHRDVIVLVDCGRLMGADAGQGTKLDCAVDAALRLMRTALRVGDRCGLGIFDNQVRGYLRPIGGTAAMQTFLASLYALDSRWRESDFGPMFATVQSRQPKRALIIVLSDVVDAETSRRYRASLVTLAQRHVVLLAALQTPLFGEFVAAPVRSIDDGFKKAVVFRVLREREQAIHQLRRTGVHVLDVEPTQLTAALINQFIELRQSNIL
jgi:uncharacterized protein (DUF58 family)